MNNVTSEAWRLEFDKLRWRGVNLATSAAYPFTRDFTNLFPLMFAKDQSDTAFDLAMERQFAPKRAVCEVTGDILKPGDTVGCFLRSPDNPEGSWTFVELDAEFQDRYLKAGDGGRYRLKRSHEAVEEWATALKTRTKAYRGGILPCLVPNEHYEEFLAGTHSACIPITYADPMGIHVPHFLMQLIRAIHGQLGNFSSPDYREAPDILLSWSQHKYLELASVIEKFALGELPLKSLSYDDAQQKTFSRHTLEKYHETEIPTIIGTITGRFNS